MEYTQWAGAKAIKGLTVKGLNPCCNGIYSMSLCVGIAMMVIAVVLILVVMEYTQWASIKCSTINTTSLNPCCNGIYSMRMSLWWILITKR